jgi:hypothetical protein
MTKQEELELFEYLGRQHKLREWLNNKKDSEVSILIQSTDIEQLRKAQGRAGLLTQMLELMNQAPAALAKTKQH